MSASDIAKNVFFTKQVTLMRRSTVLRLVSFPCTFENIALIIIFAQSFQGTLIEREGYTIDLLVLTRFYFTSYLNEEINHTKTS